jgi:hypothetical protein
MADVEWLYTRLNFWDDAVGAFEPAKVIRQVKLVFPDAEIDPTDRHRVRLLRELEIWTKSDRVKEEDREALVRQSWDNYQTNGPSYRFVVPFLSGHRVSGGVSRLSVGFQVPAGLPSECREHLLAFLRSLRMGEPTFDQPDP